MDLDLRKLRYFVAVAEHLNFGRAAEDLHIAQPVLSRQIRALEQELKAGLFVRGPRGTELTAAGQVLLEDARRLLPAADAARRRVRDVIERFPVYPELDLSIVEPGDFGLAAFETRGASAPV